MKLAQSWYDDPDAAHDAAVESTMRAFNNRAISGAECSMARGVAARCRDEAKAANAAKTKGGK